MPKRPAKEEPVARAYAISPVAHLALVGVVSIGLVSCSGDSIDGSDDAAPPSATQPAPDPEPSPSVTADLVTDPVEYFGENPGRKPITIRTSELVGQYSGVGTQEFTDLATSQVSNVTVFVTCASDVSYEVQAGTETDAEQYWYGGTGCGPNTYNSGTIPFDKGQIVSLRVEVPEDTVYTLTVYGEPS